MTLPTAGQITNLYLYGQEIVPANLIDQHLINSATRTPVEVDVHEYMTIGAGRFVSAFSFDFMRDFFSDASLSPGTYTKQQIFVALGVNDADNSVAFNNAFYGLDDADYAERTYIWGTVGFAVANDALFVVNSDGSRSVENFAIVPLQIVKNSSESRENFDFIGGFWSNVGNEIFELYNTIDPSRIGKTVTFDFVGNVTKKSLSLLDFNNLSGIVPDTSFFPDYEKIWNLTDDLFSSGVTRFLNEGKPIIYGKDTSDVLDGSIANYDLLDFYLSSHRQLGQYVNNGIVYVAGDGDDQIIATENNDVLFGNNGADTLNPGKGLDILNGGEGDDTYQIELGNFDNAIITGDADGGTISLLDGVTFRRVSGEQGGDGLFLAVSSSGVWDTGKEGWNVSVSSGMASVHVREENGVWHSIVIEGFNQASNAFGIELIDEAILPPAISFVGWDDAHPPYTGNNDLKSNEHSEAYEGDDRIVAGNNADDLSTVTHEQQYIDDPINAGAGSDQIYAAGGNDRILALGMPAAGADFPGLHGSQYSSASEALYKNALRVQGDGNGNWTPLPGQLLLVESVDEKNYIKAGDGQDHVGGASFADTIDGGLGSDYVMAGAGKDTVSGGNGLDVIYGDSYAWEPFEYAITPDFFNRDFIAPDILPEAGDYTRAYFYKEGGQNGLRYDFNILSDYNDVLDGGDDNDFIAGEIGSDIIAGGSGDDKLLGDRTWNAHLFRSEVVADRNNYQPLSWQFHGDDVIDGGSGNDVMLGGAGNDHLSGGADDDLIFGDIGLQFIDKRSVTSIKGDPSSEIKASDDHWWGDDILFGGAGADTLIGEGGDDVLVGGLQKDYLYGDWWNGLQGIAVTETDARNGKDTLFGDEGADLLVGGNSDDVLHGGADGDMLVGDYRDSALAQVGTGHDTLYGGAGHDILLGCGGNDTLLGGTGNDYLDGGEGDDDYYYAGEGTDVIGDTSGRNRLMLSASPLEVLQEQGSSFRMIFSGTADSLVLNAGVLSTFVVKVNGLTTTLKIKTAVPLPGVGSDYIRLATGSAGDDEMQGGWWNDHLSGGEGNDTLLDSAGVNRLSGEAGDDTLIGTGVLDGGDGDDILQISAGGYGSVQGGAGRDTFVLQRNGATAQLTDAVLDGDTIQVMALPDEVHLDHAGLRIFNADNTATTDAVLLFTDVSNIYSHYASGVATFNWDSWQDIQVQFADDSVWNIEDIRTNLFAGTAYTDQVAGDASNNTLYGLAGDDYLYGQGGDDVLDGGAGDDLLTGGDGNDTLIGGAGSDWMDGGAGVDVYCFGVGSGYDTVKEIDWRMSSTIRFDAGVQVGHVSLKRVEQDLQFNLVSGDTLNLAGYFDLEKSDGIRQRSLSVIFDDGTVWHPSDIETALFRGAANIMDTNNVMLGTAGSNALVGNGSRNYLYGDAGNDTLNGGGSADWLDGGAGNDTLTGGSGADVFRFGAGQDFISDAGLSDTLRLDFGTALQDVSLQAVSSSQHQLTRHDSDDRITFSHALGKIIDSEGHDLFVKQMILGVTQGEPDKYLVMRAEDLLNNDLGQTEMARWQLMSVSDTSAAQSQTGFVHIGFANDFFGTGKNVIGFIPSEGDGSFNVSLQRDDGLSLTRNIQFRMSNAALMGAEGNDVLDASSFVMPEGVYEHLNLQGQAGHDLLRGSSGDDFLSGGSGQDVLEGGWGSDTLYGGSGADVFLAEWGNDTLMGDTGDDLYQIGYLWGGDLDAIDNTTAAATDSDTIVFSGITDYRELWFGQSGTDLIATQLGQAGSLTVSHWFADTDNDGNLDNAGAGRVEQITALQHNGAVHALNLDNRFDVLLQAMSTFGAAPGAVSQAVQDMHAASGSEQTAWMAVSAA
jgi:Ca2+-binding RTX toxin-like protein